MSHAYIENTTTIAVWTDSDMQRFAALGNDVQDAFQQLQDICAPVPGEVLFIRLGDMVRVRTIVKFEEY